MNAFSAIFQSNHHDRDVIFLRGDRKFAKTADSFPPGGYLLADWRSSGSDLHHVVRLDSRNRRRESALHGGHGLVPDVQALGPPSSRIRSLIPGE